MGVKKVSRLGTQQHGGQTLGMRKRSIIVGCTPISHAKVNGKHENNDKSRKISEKKLERSLFKYRYPVDFLFCFEFSILF